MKTFVFIFLKKEIYICEKSQKHIPAKSYLILT